MVKTVKEKIAEYRENGFTANTEKLPAAFEGLNLYMDVSAPPETMISLVKLLDDRDFRFRSSNFDERFNLLEIQSDEPKAIALEFDVVKDYPRFSEAYATFVKSPAVLGIATDTTIHHQKPGFECPEVQRSNKKAPTYFGSTKVRVPFNM